MKHTVYLFKESVAEFVSALRDGKLDGEDAYTELEPRGIDFEARAFVQRNRRTRPKWLTFLEGHFDTSDLGLVNTSSSFVLLLKARGRVFAVTKGYGFTAINRDLLERNFGLRVALNTVSETTIREVRNRRIDIMTRQTVTSLSRDGVFFEFGVNVEEDLVNYISGKPADVEWAKSVAGADSLQVTGDYGLVDLHEFCGQAYDRYCEDTYKERFGFIDYIQHVRDTQVTDHLDRLLGEALDSHAMDGKLVLAYPEAPSTTHAEEWRLYHGKHERICDEVEIEELYAFHDEHPDMTLDPKSIKVAGLDDAGDYVTGVFGLYSFCVFETEFDGSKYLLSNEKWYRLDSDFVNQVDDEVSQVPRYEPAVLPPPYRGDEAEFNRHWAESVGWLLLDQRLFSPGKGVSRIEICDILSREPSLICVKRYNSSCTLSHLFSQGTVAAETLVRHGEALHWLLEQLPADWARDEVESAIAGKKTTFVYAIALPPNRAFPTSLPFFSKVNLRRSIGFIRMLGFEAKIMAVPTEDGV